MSKRDVDAAAARPFQENDAELQRVTHALKNVTRAGATFTSGASDRFPLPGIVFPGEEENELLLPLRHEDALQIKARATVSNQHHGDASGRDAIAWHMESDVLELRNPRWHAFLDERLSLMREPLGISPTAVVEIALSKLMLVDAGARMDTWGYRGVRRDDQFGTLVVVLPGAFTGGDFILHEPMQQIADDDETKEEDISRNNQETLTWRPGAREHEYDLSYAAFYDHCTYLSKPVVSGTALCLVYDLLTTTPTEIPLFAGSKLVQDEVEASLSEYLDVAPAPLAKRYKISPDAWRTINEFGAERHFVYTVRGNTFEALDDGDKKVAQSLESFCAKSQDQYVLYLASIKSGETTPSSYPPIFLRNADSVAPQDGDELVFDHHLNETDAAIVDERHRDPNATVVSTIRALVVQPASIQAVQIAKQPVEDAVVVLRSLLAESRDKAMRFARRILSHHTDWRLYANDMKGFALFVNSIVAMDDYPLFCDVLETLDFECTEKDGALYAAIIHFGWDTCVDMLVERIVTMPTLRSRVNFVVSAAHDDMVPERVGRLVDALLTLHPWTEDVIDDDCLCYFVDGPRSNQFQRLLLVAHRVSPKKLEQVIAVTDVEGMIQLVVPSLTQLVRRNPQVPWLRSALLQVGELVKPMINRIRDELYAKVRIPDHCAKCSELQAFFLATEAETTIEYTDADQRAHIEDVLERKHVRFEAYVQVESSGESAVRLTKSPGNLSQTASGRERLLGSVQHEERLIEHMMPL